MESFFMRKFYLSIPLILFCSSLKAEGIAHLTFHIAAGAENKFKIGTTIENKGKSPIYAGYVVIIPIDKKCIPQSPILKSYEGLIPGEKVTVESQIDHPISGYRISSFSAYDELGFPVRAVDDTKELIESRKEKEIKRCNDIISSSNSK